MAEKLRDGISRELRYVEYKLRKRKSDKSKKKQFNPGMEAAVSSSGPNDFQQVMPSSHGEEDLQLEVALAMSKEEAKEKEKAEMSDKLRLEMALKESAEVAAKVMAKHSPNHSNDVTSNQPIDPWGAPLGQPQPNVFDPFASAKPASEASGFGADPWGAQSDAPSQTVSQGTLDPWGGAATVTEQTNVNQSTKQSALDPWGAPPKSISLAAPPVAKNNDLKLDPWNSGEQVSQEVDPWNAGTATAVTADPWATVTNSKASMGLRSGAGDSFDPFSSQAPPQTSNPLSDFSQLTLQPSQTATSSLDLFSSGVPQATGGSTDASLTNLTSTNNVSEFNKAGAFLGNNANLVNIDNLISKPSTSHPYITMNTSGGPIGANRNPFNQKGPSMSLNQMKTDTQNPFPVQNNATPALNTVQPSTLPPMGFDMSLGTYVPAYQGFGVSGGVQPAANPFFAPQALQPNSANQPNQLLF